MLTCNMNTKTGIRYGTIYGNDVPDVLDRIQSNGKNVSSAKRRADLKDNLLGTIESSFSDFDEDDTRASLDASHKDACAEYMVKVVHNAIREATSRGERVFDKDDAEQVFDKYLADGSIDADSILSDMENRGLWDDDQNDEDDYEYVEHTDNGEIHYEQTWLGGAALIYVKQSPYFVEGRFCSPCVPNAVNLKEEGSIKAYSLKPSETPEDCPQPMLLDEETRAKHSEGKPDSE